MSHNNSDHNIRIYMAPMEGLTGYIYRGMWNRYYGDADRFFTPFIAAEGSRKMKKREIRDILPENNTDCNVVPQIISNNADNFIRFAKLIREYGYNEVNLNLGCPSGTVVSRHKGSGFLGVPDELDRFLDSIYSGCDGMNISIKTRIGLNDPEEIYDLMTIYNRYPVSELIVHPRIRKDYYKHEPRMEYFEYVYDNSVNPVGYNGNVYSKEGYDEIAARYPKIGSIMIGRGLIRNPALAGIIKGRYNNIDIDTLKEFHDAVYNEYRSTIDAEQVIVFKMKEIWTYMLDLFADDGTFKRMLNKCRIPAEYSVFAGRIFRECILKCNDSERPEWMI